MDANFKNLNHKYNFFLQQLFLAPYERNFHMHPVCW